MELFEMLGHFVLFGVPGNEGDDTELDEVREERNEEVVERVSSLETEVLLVRLTRGSALTGLQGEGDRRAWFDPKG